MTLMRNLASLLSSVQDKSYTVVNPYLEFRETINHVMSMLTSPLRNPESTMHLFHSYLESSAVYIHCARTETRMSIKMLNFSQKPVDFQQNGEGSGRKHPEISLLLYPWIQMCSRTSEVTTFAEDYRLSKCVNVYVHGERNLQKMDVHLSGCWRQRNWNGSQVHLTCTCMRKWNGWIAWHKKILNKNSHRITFPIIEVRSKLSTTCFAWGLCLWQDQGYPFNPVWLFV